MEEAGELLGQNDPALAIPEVLDAVLVRLPAQVLDQPLFQPVGGVDDQRLERMVRLRELGDRGADLVPGRSGIEPDDVEVVGAAFRIEEDRLRQTARQRRLADAFGSVGRLA